MQLEIDCIEWALQKIEVNKVPNDRPEDWNLPYLDSGHLYYFIQNQIL
jgi:hypothetical protein